MIKLKINIWVTLLFSVWTRFTLMSVGARSVSNPFEAVVNGEGQSETGTRWAVLVAGSNGYENYRHQADVCHAYQILKNGGLKDENIIVFMYDDIANDPQNPRPGIIINKPNGTDVYKGVPKDYTGNDTNAKNFYAVLSGNRSALSGGSGKVVDSGPNDIIFIYYTDHGATGLVCMPVGDYVMAHDFVNVLKKKHAAKSYKKMVIYLEACESGSMFEGLLPDNINIYATTASKPDESSYAYYCPDSDDPPPPSEYETCLGDKYSISWLEDSDQNDLTKETLSKQYQSVHRRTLKCSVNESDEFSHVMQYGDKKFVNDFVATYLGAPDSGHDTYYNPISSNNPYTSEPSTTQTGKVSQRDAYLLYLRLKLGRAQNGSKKLKAQKALDDEIAHREHVHNVVHLIGNLLFGEENSSTMMLHVRPSGQPVVDDWDCFKTLIKTFESQCGALSNYGKKYTRVFANLCNAGISAEQMVVASSQACPKENHVS